MSDLANELNRAIALALENTQLDEPALSAVLPAILKSCRAGVENPQDPDFRRLLDGAREVRRKFFRAELHLCAIVNAKSGACTEDCAFCAQSSRHKTASPRHGFLEPEEIARQAAAMKARGASRFGIVASGLAPGEADFEKLLRAVSLVAATGLAADVSVGLLTPERLERLKGAGLSGVHHNLEVARSFFPQICTTHDYEEDVQAVRLARQAGLFVCSGGIFGLGESWEQRAELALTLRELGVENVPVNFLMPIAGTRLEHRPVLAPAEALGVLALLKLLLPQANLRVCGGRGTVFGQAGQRDVFLSSASGLMIGDYLTLAGTPAKQDLDLAAKLGLVVCGPEG